MCSNGKLDKTELLQRPDRWNFSVPEVESRKQRELQPKFSCDRNSELLQADALFLAESQRAVLSSYVTCVDYSHPFVMSIKRTVFKLRQHNGCHNLKKSWTLTPTAGTNEL